MTIYNFCDHIQMYQLIITVQNSDVPSLYKAGEGSLNLIYAPVPEQGREWRLCLPHALRKRNAHQHLAAVPSFVCLDLSFITKKRKPINTGGINNGCMNVSWGSLAVATRCCTEIKQEMHGHSFHASIVLMFILKFLFSTIMQVNFKQCK